MLYLKLTEEQKLQVLLGLFVGCIVMANLLGTKIADFGIFAASVGIFAYPITFLVTDIVADVYGKGKVKGFIISGLIVNIVMFLLVALSVWLPPASRYESNAAYMEVFNPSMRIILASVIAFLISQTHDMVAFEFWKKKTKGRFLWFRNNTSTILSQFIDTVIFMFVAFYMVTPSFTADFVFALIIPYWLVKVLVALLDTPFVYLGVWWLKGKK